MGKIYCDLCNSEMKFIEKVNSKKYYKIKRYDCICGAKKTTFGSSYIDQDIEPRKAIEAVDKMYKQQNENDK